MTVYAWTFPNIVIQFQIVLMAVMKRIAKKNFQAKIQSKLRHIKYGQKKQLHNKTYILIS